MAPISQTHFFKILENPDRKFVMFRHSLSRAEGSLEMAGIHGINSSLCQALSKQESLLYSFSMKRRINAV
jgi:hypothetical protein